MGPGAIRRRLAAAAKQAFTIRAEGLWAIRVDRRRGCLNDRSHFNKFSFARLCSRIANPKKCRAVAEIPPKVKFSSKFVPIVSKPHQLW
jgi:hypothetical protein